MGIRVLLVDDHKILREGLKQLLEQEDGVVVAATAGTAEEALVKARGASVDVALIDLSLPDKSGTWLLAQLVQELPGVRVIVLSMHSDETTVLGVLEAGASGYLTKGAEPTEVIAAIRSVHSGGSYVQAELAPFLIGALRRQGKSAPEDLSLDQRELDVLGRVSKGQSNQKIAEELFLSLSTVKAQLRGLFRKLEASTRTELVMEAIRRGLIEQPKQNH